VQRPEAARLARAVHVTATGGGDHLLAGEVEIEIRLAGGAVADAALALPPGAPGRPPTDDELGAKLERGAGADAERIADLSWESAAHFLRRALAG
jgi:hypothetical protein